MDVKGQRILIFGDSLTARNGAPAQVDVTEPLPRTSSSPGDLLASWLLAAGAAAVRLDARVGRSAWNFWQREDTKALLAGDLAWRPTLVIVWLGTNDIGLNLTKDRQALERIRDAFTAVGAKVIGIGPPAFAIAHLAEGTPAVLEMHRRVFGPAVIDARPLSQDLLTGGARTGDGVHFTAAGASALAPRLAQAVLALTDVPLRPSKIWKPLGWGFGITLGLGAVVGGLVWVSRRRTQLGAASDGRLPYVGQCDTIRRGSCTGEAFWQEMMATAKPISRQAFARHVDPAKLLDADETLDEFVADDPTAGFYAARVAGRPVYFVATGGFEFIFTDLPPPRRHDQLGAPTRSKRLIGYRVMRYVNGEAVSGADSRIRVPLEKGAIHAYPRQGMFLAPSAQYVRDFYGNHDRNVLLTYEYDPAEITSGSLDDREPEISVRQARLIGWQVFDEDGQDLGGHEIARLPARLPTLQRQQAAQAALERIGWTLNAVELDEAAGTAKVELRRHDGRLVTFFRDGHGRSSITREQARTETARVGRRGDAAVVERRREEFLGREALPPGTGLRAGLRSLANYVGDNALQGDRQLARQAIALLLPG